MPILDITIPDSDVSALNLAGTVDTLDNALTTLGSVNVDASISDNVSILDESLGLPYRSEKSVLLESPALNRLVCMLQITNDYVSNYLINDINIPSIPGNFSSFKKVPIVTYKPRGGLPEPADLNIKVYFEIDRPTASELAKLQEFLYTSTFYVLLEYSGIEYTPPKEKFNDITTAYFDTITKILGNTNRGVDALSTYYATFINEKKLPMVSVNTSFRMSTDTIVETANAYLGYSGIFDSYDYTVDTMVYTSNLVKEYLFDPISYELSKLISKWNETVKLYKQITPEETQNIDLLRILFFNNYIFDARTDSSGSVSYNRDLAKRRYLYIRELVDLTYTAMQFRSLTRDQLDSFKGKTFPVTSILGDTTVRPRRISDMISFIYTNVDNPEGSPPNSIIYHPDRNASLRKHYISY